MPLLQRQSPLQTVRTTSKPWLSSKQVTDPFGNAVRCRLPKYWRRLSRTDMARRATSPTMREIAERANVSIGTVSRVLNRHEDVDEKLRDRVESIARKVGYAFSARTRNAV